ncbi:MAG: EAL domain-containing protein [Butyricicoccus sp.]|nr:EAL domain-containing protein [Butyricicoccus sp.]
MEFWEFFEKLDEMVYVTDVETNRLVYMNAHLRKALGFQSHEEYQGKMCYEVLQGCNEPCPFCTNEELKPGEFVSWTHKNPVMNSHFLIKDSVIHSNGHKYRIEIAINIDRQVVCKAPYYYARSETILNECLHQVFSGTTPEESIENMLTYIGKTFLCDRTYIFETYEDERMSNTYEWCAPGITEQKEILQNEPLESIQWWMDLFQENSVVVIENIEDIRTQYPSAYALLKPQGISSLVVGPIAIDGKVIGFLGADNPSSQMLGLITPLLSVIGYFVSSLLRRRDLLKCLNDLSFRDQLTGAFNRNAMAEYCKGRLEMDSIGVVYCDITGLKRMNDANGHAAGDAMIQHCYNLLAQTLDTDLIYRIGGDEFVALYPNCEESYFEEQVHKLHAQIHQDEYHIAVGYTWSNRQPLCLETLITQADQIMYQDKREYYRATGQSRRNPMAKAPDESDQPESVFQRFVSATYCNMESMFQSIAQENASSYFYFGDMQKSMFYISDNMREDFGFPSNVVPGLLRQWSQRISTPEFQDLFWQDVSSMLREKRTRHDLRYQVRDAHGNIKWVRCYSLLKWNEDKTKPLFLSGRITHQDKEFVIDPITNFPREQAAIGPLDDLRKRGEKTLIIGFSLNNITEINNTKGRPFTDCLMKNIAGSLMENLAWKMAFYRLEGMRCMAIVQQICAGEREELVQQIRELVETCYHEMGIAVQTACSFGLIEYPYEDMTPEDLIETVVSLIRVAKQDIDQPYVCYSTQNVQRIRQMSNMALTLSQDVLNGMENFRIVIQPVVSAESGQVIGGETLLRWTFQGKDISPAVFIPILERENMIHRAGRWVFDQAVRNCMRLITYNPSFYLTFNVSLHQLSDTHFLDFMAETLDKYRLDGSHMVAELTESCLDEQPEKLTAFVEGCSKLGIRIALDDFGSGYSSLRMLLQYPSSIIKLDRSLLTEMTESADKKNFISSIVYACHRFGKKVCMEGVETEVQDTLIKDAGCDTIQGYYYYRPMELSNIYALLSEG